MIVFRRPKHAVMISAPSAGDRLSDWDTNQRGDGGGGSRQDGSGSLSARGVGRGAFVGVKPPSGDHVLQRASVDDGSKPYVSAQRGSNKH